MEFWNDLSTQKSWETLKKTKQKNRLHSNRRMGNLPMDTCNKIKRHRYTANRLGNTIKNKKMV
ncbi:MAG: hypothetical protein DRN08_03985 [Thermoplasmata archaeon]|nr:MAG: hypothetical protein DRN08_03985 [Thermoplasmata archaeon]